MAKKLQFAFCSILDVSGPISVKKIAECIGLKGPLDVLSVAILGGERSESKRFQRERFTLSPIRGHPTEAVEMEALTLPTICNPLLVRTCQVGS